MNKRSSMYAVFASLLALTDEGVKLEREVKKLRPKMETGKKNWKKKHRPSAVRPAEAEQGDAGSGAGG